MNRLVAILLVGWATAGAAAEQNPAPATKTNAPRTIDIFSEEADFDLQNRVLIYRGNVRVIDPQMKLRSDRLTAWMAPTNNQFTNIVAEGSVEIQITDEQGPSRATGGRAVYDAATDTVELTQNPVLINKLGTLTSDRVVLSRANNRLEARGHVHIVMPAEALKQPSLVTPKKPPAEPRKDQ